MEYWNFPVFQYSNISSGNIEILEFSRIQKLKFSNFSSRNIWILEFSRIPIFQYFNISSGNIGILKFSKIAVFQYSWGIFQDSNIPIFLFFLWKEYCNFPDSNIPIFPLEILEYWHFSGFQYFLFKYWNIEIFQDPSIPIFQYFLEYWNFPGFQYFKILQFYRISVFQYSNISSGNF